jgi:hypothetical protein
MLSRLAAHAASRRFYATTTDRSSSKALLSSILAKASARPGKPWQNGVTESLNGKLWDECLILE